MFPMLASARIDYCWGGLVDMTADRLPHAGQHDGIYFSMGYSGHGTQMSTHMGQVMADVMDGHDERQSVARVRVARDSRPYRQALVPAAGGHVLPHQGHFLLIRSLFDWQVAISQPTPANLAVTLAEKFDE